ncbi:MAG: TetR/AcrR family transcriptional regulator [Candidatus Cloacimonetes bacterium]|nr:TetR/AcrR family transcriptional regulator [Candidatus Cloacimonadota bacterium]
MVEIKKGRPHRNQEKDTRQSILDAAEVCFSKHPYDQVSLREIAELAGVNSALIPYYYKSKKGLYYAFLESSLGLILKKMQVLLESSVSQKDSLENYVHGMLSIFAEKPWLLQFIFREILVGQQDLQRFYVNAFARHTGKFLPMLLEGLPEKTGINTRYSALSLLSMLVFPFIAESLAGPAFDITYDEEFRNRLGKHILLVMKGEHLNLY